MAEIIVRDLRPDGDASFAVVPRLFSWSDAEAFFGVRHLDDYGAKMAPAGALYWALTEVYVRTGVAAYIPQVEDEDGTPYWHQPTNTGALLVRTWPGCEDIPVNDPLRPDYNTLIGPAYRSHTGVLGWTNENGDVGFAYGGGSVTGPGGGPDAIWVHAAPVTTDGPQYSDCIANLGWIGGTDHCTLNPVFRLTRKGGSPEPPAGDSYLLIYHAGEVIGHVAIQPGPPPPEGGFTGLALATGGVVVWRIPSDGQI